MSDELAQALLAKKDMDTSEFIPNSYKISRAEALEQNFYSQQMTKFQLEAAGKCI